MQDVLIVVDMQNDFIDGALGSAEAVAIVPAVKDKLENFSGTVYFTRDTHGVDYLETQEGRRLPVPHCVRGTDGWQICDALKSFADASVTVDKPSFGSEELCSLLKAQNQKEPIGQITLVGLCTDICVISNAMLIKAALPEVAVTVDAACCAGVTPESHKNALSAMQMCQITVENA